MVNPIWGNHRQEVIVERDKSDETRCEHCGGALDPEDATTWGYVPGWGVIHLCDRCYQKALDECELAAETSAEFWEAEDDETS